MKKLFTMLRRGNLEEVAARSDFLSCQGPRKER